MGRAQPRHRRAYAHKHTPPARPQLRVLPQPDSLDDLTPEVRACGPLFERHPIDVLRSIVRRSVASDFLGWAHGAHADEMKYIIGVTKDAYVFYSDGIGMTGQRLEVVAEVMLERIAAASAAGERYDPLVRDFLLYGGHLPRPYDGC